MAEFISKLQHKTYEKGEFSDEKVRTLAETIELIRTFPWDQERTLTSVELTGPSVTIRDENINWLKIGLYFNGKYCLYYLDNNNHLYEYHASNLDDACDIVKTFFNQQLDLQKFEKHFLNIGNQTHFDTKYFEYRVKLWRVIMLMPLILFYTIALTAIDVLLFTKNNPLLTKSTSVLLTVFFTLASLVFYIVLYKIVYSAVKNRNNYLQLSKGNPVFHFAYDENQINAYNKADIKEVLIYESRGGRNPNFVAVFEICFKDGTILKFSNMLISGFSLESKFQEDLLKRGKKGPLRML